MLTDTRLDHPRDHGDAPGGTPAPAGYTYGQHANNLNEVDHGTSSTSCATAFGGLGFEGQRTF
jgi:hypothetical protein